MLGFKINSNSSPISEVEEILQVKKDKKNSPLKIGSLVLYAMVALAFIISAVMVGADYFVEEPQYVIRNEGQFSADADLSGYPESLQNFYKNNFEAAGYVVNYHEYKDKTVEINLDSYKNSETAPLFMQWDLRWGYKMYGGDFAGITADAPLCISMVGFYLTGDAEKFSPDKVISFAEEGNYYKTGTNTRTSFLTTGADSLGLKVGSVTPANENIIACLQQKNGEKNSPIICLMKPGKLSSAYRYVVFRGLDSEGNILINDPNSIINSERAWKFEDISKEIHSLWCYALA